MRWNAEWSIFISYFIYERSKRNELPHSGVCKGWTLAQVAERRAPSLRFYVFSDNGDNVLKAAATIVLNDMGMRKAG